MEYLLSLSYGKDSMACIGACAELGWKIDRIVHAEVWATKTISANFPKMVEFKAKADQIIKERYGIIVEHRHAMRNGEKYTYDDYFNHVLEKGKHIGSIKGFPMQRNPWCQQLKVGYGAKITDMTNIIQYLGIASDEPIRIARQKDVPNIKLPLVEIGWTEKDCMDWCIKNDLRSPQYDMSARDGCWFCHNQGVDQLRLLRRDYPNYWKILLEWDKKSPVPFHADGHTVLDFEKRFDLEDKGFIKPSEKWKWEYIKVPIGKQITIDELFI